MIKIKFKINIIQLIYLVSIVAFLAILISFTLFLYNSFYRSFVQISDIYELQNKVSLETVNIKMFEEVKSKIKIKQSTPEPDIDNITNPFN